MLASGGDDLSLRLYDLVKDEVVYSFDSLHKDYIRCMASI